MTGGVLALVLERRIAGVHLQKEFTSLKYIINTKNEKNSYISMFFLLINYLSLHGFPNLFLLSFFKSFLLFFLKDDNKDDIHYRRHSVELLAKKISS